MYLAVNRALGIEQAKLLSGHTVYKPRVPKDDAGYVGFSQHKLT